MRQKAQKYILRRRLRPPESSGLVGAPAATGTLLGGIRAAGGVGEINLLYMRSPRPPEEPEASCLHAYNAWAGA